jgi:hypothetical protein
VTIIRFLIAWPNAPFTVAFGIAALFALLQVSGVLGLLGGGSDHDGDHEVDHDVDHDHAGFVGKIPFALIWQTWAIVFAITGLMLNVLFFGAVSTPMITLVWTLPAGIVAGAVAVALVSRLLGPVFATRPHEATSRAELVGLSGVVISSRVTDDFGEVRVRDKSGHDLRVICRLAPGSLPPREHDRVVVVEYVDDADALLVAPIDETDEVEGKRA